MWIWMCVLFSLESTDTKTYKYPELIAFHSKCMTQADLAYVSCDVKSVAFDEFVTDQVSLEYRNTYDMAFDMLDFTMPIVSGTSIEKCEVYLEKRLCASLSYVEFVGAIVNDRDVCSNVSCRSTFIHGLFSVCIKFTDGSRSSKMVMVKVCWSQRPCVFRNASGVLEKQYIFPRRSWYIRPGMKSLSGLLEKVSGNYSFTFSINTQNVQRWNVYVRNKCSMEGSVYRVMSPYTTKDIVCVFTAKEDSNGLLVQHFRFQNHNVLAISVGLSGSGCPSHATSPREVVFAVDTSRYMNSYRYVMLLEALERLFETTMGLEIYVNVVFFNHSADATVRRSMRISNADDMLEVKEKIRLNFIHRGERNVLSGLEKVVSLERVRRDGELLERNVILITSGVDRNSDEIEDLVRRETRNGVRFFAIGVGKIASYDVLAKITKLGRGSCDFIQRAQDTGNCISAMLEKTGSPGYKYDCRSLDIEDRGITRFIVNRRLSLGKRPVQVPLRRHEPRAFACEAFKTYLVFKHGVPDQVELTFGEEKHTCRWSEFKLCKDAAAEKELAKDFMRHVNREFYLLVHNVSCHTRRQSRCDGEDTNECLVALTNIIAGDALLVECISSEQEDRLFKFAEKYIGKHSIYDQSMCVGVPYFNSVRSRRIITGLLQGFEPNASFKVALSETHLILYNNGVDAFTIERLVKKCRKRKAAKEKGLFGDTEMKLFILTEAIKLVLGPLDRECASIVSYKSAAMGLWGNSKAK